MTRFIALDWAHLVGCVARGGKVILLTQTEISQLYKNASKPSLVLLQEIDLMQFKYRSMHNSAMKLLLWMCTTSMFVRMIQSPGYLPFFFWWIPGYLPCVCAQNNFQLIKIRVIIIHRSSSFLSQQDNMKIRHRK